MLRLNFDKKLKIKRLVAWSISDRRVDQKQIINFVWPNIITSYMYLNYTSNQNKVDIEDPRLITILCRLLEIFSDKPHNLLTQISL